MKYKFILFSPWLLNSPETPNPEGEEEAAEDVPEGEGPRGVIGAAPAQLRPRPQLGGIPGAIRWLSGGLFQSSLAFASCRGEILPDTSWPMPSTLLASCGPRVHGAGPR